MRTQMWLSSCQSMVWCKLKNNALCQLKHDTWIFLIVLLLCFCVRPATKSLWSEIPPPMVELIGSPDFYPCHAPRPAFFPTPFPLGSPRCKTGCTIRITLLSPQNQPRITTRLLQKQIP